MTVAELIEQLKGCPPDAVVLVDEFFPTLNEVKMAERYAMRVSENKSITSDGSVPVKSYRHDDYEGQIPAILLVANRA